MHSLSQWFIRNPVASNLLMLLLLLWGLLTLAHIRIEGFPAIPPRSVTITTLCAGAGAEQVDRGISTRIQQAIRDLPGIKRTHSVSSEGVSMVQVEKSTDASLDRLHGDLKTRVDAIDNLPKSAERPTIVRDEFNIPALYVQVYGETDEPTLQQVSRRVKDELLAHPLISKIDLYGDRKTEIRIETDAARLESFGLSNRELARAIEAHSLDYRTGTLKSGGIRFQLRADGKAFHYEDFAEIPVKTLPDGSRILLQDVARVVEDYEDREVLCRFQGKPSVGMMIRMNQKGNLLKVSEAAQQVVDALKGKLPEKVHVDLWGDYSVYMKDRLSLLSQNAWKGLLLVFVILAVFLDIRLAFWVAMGIPVALSGVLMVMGSGFLDYSLNEITTFGLIIVLGVLVDDAVIVGESIFEQRTLEKDGVKGAVKGVKRVATATVFGCLTTCAAFFPLLLIENDLGKIFAGFSTIVIIALFFSLIESKLILPAHLARIPLNRKRPFGTMGKIWKKFQQKMRSLLNALNTRVYQPVLRKALFHRYAALLLLGALGATGIGMIFNKQIKTVFFPEIPGSVISVKLEMESGAPPDLVFKNMEIIEKGIDRVNGRLMKKYHRENPPVKRVLVSLENETHVEAYAETAAPEQRETDILEIVRLWRKETGSLEGAESLSFTATEDMGGGFAIQVEAMDTAMLPPAVDDLSRFLGAMAGVRDVRNDLAGGEREIRLRLKPEAQHLGLTASDLAQQIGDGFGGLEVQRIQRHSEEVKVMLRVRDDRRRHMDDLLRTKIRTSDGRWLPLGRVARMETGYAPGNISRRNGRRTVRIMANLDKGMIEPEAVFEAVKSGILPALAAQYPGIRIRAAGELEEITEVRSGLKRALIIILLLIYGLLAVPLKSYLQPLVIMAIIPFGFAGAVAGHKIAGIPLSIISFFGMMALAGVVVNDSLVMLTRFNELRNGGATFHEALVQAGASRFRAIFLTTVTTVAGLLPLLWETSEQARYLIPAAVSLAYGELFATPVTLILIPILVRVGHDVRGWITRLKKEGNDERKTPYPAGGGRPAASGTDP